MTKTNYLKHLSLVLLIAFIFIGLLGCGGCGEDDKTYYDNEVDKLVFSSQEVDKVFNPFFATTGPDNSVIGLTQIGMISNDASGNPSYGDDEAVVTKDLQIVSNGEGDDLTTTYYFVLKNNVKFSNGSPLTIKDVLFNLYVYLDPVYSGSSTIYSTDIVGLKEYRTQQDSENEQDSFEAQFAITANDRINALVTATQDIKKEHKSEILTVDSFKGYLKEYAKTAEYYTNIEKDFDRACVLFKEELESDYNNSIDQYENIKFYSKTKDGKKDKEYSGLFTTDVETFLFNEGFIHWDYNEAKLTSDFENDVTKIKSYTKEEAIKKVYDAIIPNSIDQVVQYWATATKLTDELIVEAKNDYFNSNEKKYKNISGIKFANIDSSIKVNGKEYKKAEYNADGSVKEGFNEVLSITINDVDPKAIWNFSFGVAPMYYYSSKEYIDKFDFVENFGVEYGSTEFMNEVIKDSEKIGVPVGAGPYAASRESGGIENVKSGEFYSLGVIYYERNPYFLMGPAKIKNVRYQVVAANRMLDTLYNNEIDFIEPNSKPETIKELNGKAEQGIGNKSIQTSGYGYIGINAGKVPDIEVRQAIMHAIDVEECVKYYKGDATRINRAMSKSSWAYPKDSTPYYPYIGGQVPENLDVVNPYYAEYVTSLGKKAKDTLTAEEQDNFIKTLVESAGYTLNSSGVYVNSSGHDLVYVFTIAGEEQDHPAWQALYHASEVLNRNGFQINVTTDSNALKKLNSGELTVWAAAWGSTIDPDMYQVYHRDSKATSILNWGYKQIANDQTGKYSYEKVLIDELSEIIEEARKTNNQTQRARKYSEALDIVMQLAIELPTYQRNDLFAYNTNKIDVNTFNKNTSPFKGLISDIHTVSLNVEK